MGLDMYLTKKTYVKQWESTPEEKRTTIKVEGWLSSSIGGDRITHIEEEVGYWRKANHIHQWFVNNVQHGEDDCGEYYVSLDDIKSLAKLCLAVKEDNSLAEDLLPVQSGFFSFSALPLLPIPHYPFPISLPLPVRAGNRSSIH